MLRRVEQLVFRSKCMVPTAGLEPAQVAPLAPQTSASTNFATSAFSWAAPKNRHGLRQTFPRGSLREAARSAGRNNSFAGRSLRRLRWIRRLRRRRARGRRRGRERRRRCFGRRGSSSSLSGAFQNRGGLHGCMRSEIRQCQTRDKEQARKHRGQLREQCARSARTEHRARCARAESGARFGALAPLQQHQSDNH